MVRRRPVRLAPIPHAAQHPEAVQSKRYRVLDGRGLLSSKYGAVALLTYGLHVNAFFNIRSMHTEKKIVSALQSASLLMCSCNFSTIFQGYHKVTW
jgi:hypothetical protein